MVTRSPPPFEPSPQGLTDLPDIGRRGVGQIEVPVPHQIGQSGYQGRCLACIHCHRIPLRRGLDRKSRIPPSLFVQLPQIQHRPRHEPDQRLLHEAMQAQLATAEAEGAASDVEAAEMTTQLKQARAEAQAAQDRAAEAERTDAARRSAGVLARLRAAWRGE